MSERDTLDALVEDVKNTCGGVFSILTDPEKPYADDEQRIASAANEVRELFLRTEARLVFHDAGLNDSAATNQTDSPEGP